MIIARYGELGLKGKNRSIFEKKIVENIKACLHSNNVPFKKIKRVRGRILIDSEKTYCLKQVFGLVSFSNVVHVCSSFKDLKKSILASVKLTKKDSFRVTCKRLDRSLKKASREVECELGDLVNEATGASVDLTKFDLEVCTEYIEGNFYLFFERVKCFGGLPVGTQGKVMVILQKKQDSLAAILALKRGCEVFPVAIKKVDTSLLEKYAHGTKVKLHKLESFTKLPMLSEELKTKAVIVGQRLSDYSGIPIDIPVLRPLIAYTEKQIKEELDEFRKV